jgi:thioredoxin-dependent peroxiredoxin
MDRGGRLKQLKEDNMAARKIKFKGSPLTLVGRNLTVGTEAPEFKVISQDLAESRLSFYSDKIKVITFFPSLDTPVCDLQVKEFNKKAAGLSDKIMILGISKDLPFAQQRFCSENDIKNIKVLSDYRFSSFGLNYGLLIKELNLLARGACIVDNKGILRYLQIVDELSAPPDYSAVLAALDEVVKKPDLGVSPGEKPVGHCEPCEGAVPALGLEKVKTLLAELPDWELVENKKIVREFKFEDYQEAKYFLDLIALIAEEEEHHPAATLMYKSVRITLTTHTAKGLSDNDFVMAGIIDRLGI